MRRTWMIALLLGLAFTTPAYAEVDAVTGATLTSDGVSNMLQEGFAKYKNYLKK